MCRTALLSIVAEPLAYLDTFDHGNTSLNMQQFRTSVENGCHLTRLRRKISINCSILIKTTTIGMRTLEAQLEEVAVAD